MQINKYDIEKFIQEQRWEYRENGDEFQIISGCPFCKHEGPNHFYIHQEKGQYHCHRCGQGGSFFALKKEFGSNEITKTPMKQTERAALKKPAVSAEAPNITEEMVDGYHKKLFETERILKWLKEDRGLKEETIKHFKLGWDGRRITIPMYSGGKLVTMRFRKDPADTSDFPKYQSLKGSEAMLFNEDVLAGNPKSITIVEGELDLMIFHQEIMPQVVTSTGGCMTFKDEWVSKFKKVNRINICFDNDEAGIQGAHEVAKKLGWPRCWNILLPKKPEEKKKDISDFFNVDKRSVNDFRKVYAAARKFPELSDEKISSVGDIIDVSREHLINGKKIRGLLTGFDITDNYLEGFLPGDLIILSGQTGVGKTLTAQAFAMNMLRAGKTVMFFSLEMLPSELVQRFITIETPVNMQKYANMNKSSSLKDYEIKSVDNTVSSLRNKPLYFYTGDDTLDFTLLEQVSANAVNKYGAEIIFIDHLHYFARGDAKTRSVEIGDLVRKIKLLARKLNVPILLISHLRKIGDYSSEPSIDDLRDSSMSGQDADIVILLMRNKTAADRGDRLKMKLRIAKNRHGREEDVDFEFHSDNMRLEEKIYFNGPVPPDAASMAKYDEAAGRMQYQQN